MREGSCVHLTIANILIVMWPPIQHHSLFLNADSYIQSTESICQEDFLRKECKQFLEPDFNDWQVVMVAEIAFIQPATSVTAIAMRFRRQQIG